jgi:hypothetical protein
MGSHAEVRTRVDRRGLGGRQGTRARPYAGIGRNVSTPPAVTPQKRLLKSLFIGSSFHTAPSPALQARHGVRVSGPYRDA